MIRQTEVDGVPALIAPTSGPMNAGLVFRVGRADETLARGGITHLVEHLALHGHGLTDYHFNGSTGPVTTHFHMQGSETDVVDFLTGVCRSLAELPVERIETEKAVLRTESAGRTRGTNAAMPMYRYGARDFGLVSYPEWGLGQLRVEDLRQWIDTWFTRDNAVLWVTGDDIPTGLRLPLPGGQRRPVPPPSSALPALPAYFADDANGVVFDAVVRRSVAAGMFAGVLRRELFRQLRQEGGISYTIDTSYDPRGDSCATVTAIADALPEQQDAALGGFIDVLAQLRVGRINEADLDAVRTRTGEPLSHPDLAAARLPTYAINLLTGQANLSVTELRDAIDAVSVDEIRAVAGEAMDTALLMVPSGHGADWAGFVEAPVFSADTVTGRRYRSLESDDVALILGADGASLVTPDGPVTVRFDGCAASLSWPDGARYLIGYDAVTLRIEPTMLDIDRAALAAIDAAVHPSVVVWLRDGPGIPGPSRSPPNPRGRSRRRPGRRPDSRPGAAGRRAAAAWSG